MSGNRETIRDYITNTERFDGKWHRLPTEQETLAALDALLAEIQRLRDALETIATMFERVPPGTREATLFAREAVAGDGE